MAKKKEKRTCVFCREQEAETWPVLTWNGIDICFTCLENMLYQMLREPMGDQAAQHMLHHVGPLMWRSRHHPPHEAQTPPTRILPQKDSSCKTSHFIMQYTRKESQLTLSFAFAQEPVACDCLRSLSYALPFLYIQLPFSAQRGVNALGRSTIDPDEASSRQNSPKLPCVS